MAENNKDIDEDATFLGVMAGTVLLGVIAFVLSLIFNVPLLQLISFDINDILVGVIGVLPLALFLWWFSNTDISILAEFRKSQLQFFEEIGFRFTLPRIAAMSLGAGVFEELLFRGFLQTWLTGIAGVAGAVLIANLIFGALHWRTALYAIIAGVVGVWMSILFLYTDNLLTPIVTHAVYDAVALEYARRALGQQKA